MTRFLLQVGFIVSSLKGELMQVGTRINNGVLAEIVLRVDANGWKTVRETNDAEAVQLLGDLRIPTNNHGVIYSVDGDRALAVILESPSYKIISFCLSNPLIGRDVKTQFDVRDKHTVWGFVKRQCAIDASAEIVEHLKVKHGLTASAFEPATRPDFVPVICVNTLIGAVEGLLVLDELNCPFGILQGDTVLSFEEIAASLQGKFLVECSLTVIAAQSKLQEAALQLQKVSVADRQHEQYKFNVASVRTNLQKAHSTLQELQRLAGLL